MVLVLLLIAAASPPSSSTVYIMRHCARSTYLPDLYGGQRPAYLANYSDGGDLPDWGVAPTLCTAPTHECLSPGLLVLQEDCLA